MPQVTALSLMGTPEPVRSYSDAPEAGIFVILIVAAEGIAGELIHLKNVTASSGMATIRALSGLILPTTIERLVEITISSPDGGVLLMADGVSNWEIQARVGT